MKPYRTRLRIVHDILDTMREGPTYKTDIMYKAMMNHAQLQEKIPRLIKKGFMVESDGMFALTEKGMQTLNEVTSMLEREEAIVRSTISEG